MVGIAYGKGVVLRVPYTKMNGPFFGSISVYHLPGQVLNKKGGVYSL